MAEPTAELTELTVRSERKVELSDTRKECTEAHGAVECIIQDLALTADSTDQTVDSPEA